MNFDPVEICAVLSEEGVDFVVLGGFAAFIHGSSLPTEDIDLIPSQEWANLERLARALSRLDAKIRTSGDAVATNLDAGFIKNIPHMLNLVTKYGDMNLTFTPAGALKDYEAWRAHARLAQLRDGLVVSVASLDDIITSKHAADRPKDHRALRILNHYVISCSESDLSDRACIDNG